MEFEFRETAATGSWGRLRDQLERRKREILAALRGYPQPIAGCDVQFNFLCEQRDAIFRELDRLTACCGGRFETPAAPEQRADFLRDSPFLRDEAAARVR